MATAHASATSACAENSFRARRLYTSNSSPAALWACAVGLTILAFPNDRRCRTRRSYFAETSPRRSDERDGATGSGNVAIVASIVAVLVVYGYADSVWPALELLLLFFSIPVAWYSSTWIACALHASGMVIYTVGRLGSPLGFDLSFLTHWFVSATLLITIVLAADDLYQLAPVLVVRLQGAVHCVARECDGVAPRGPGLDPALPDDCVAGHHQRLRRVPDEDGQLAVGQPAVGDAAQPGAFSSRRRSWAGASRCTTSASIGGCCGWCGLRCPSCSERPGRSTLFARADFVPYGTTGDAASIVIATLAATLPWVLSGIVMC